MAGPSDAPRVSVRLLGPLEVRVDGAVVDVGGPRARSVLALLALSAGTALTTRRLVEVLWDTAPPQAAANTVQVYVSRLRRALCPPGMESPLRTVPGGYLLALPPEAVDVLAFEGLTEQGHALLTAGDAAGAIRTLARSLALWRGPALPDLAEVAGGAAVLARVEARRLAATIDRIDADLRLGGHVRVLPELQELVRLRPLDEGLVARLMMTLYRCGRQGEALEAYTKVSRRLADELGVDPGPQLREVHGEVLRHELAPAPPVTAPADALPTGTAPTGALPTGTAPTGPLPTGTIPTELAPEADPGDASVPGTVPGATPGGRIGPGPAAFVPPWGPLIGRRDELTRALELVADPAVRLVTLVGPGGTGKTRLAQELAAVLSGTATSACPEAERSPGDGARMVTLVGLAAVRDAGELPVEVCRVLDAAPGWAGEPLLDVAVRALAGHRAVLVLDNVEQMADGPALGPDLDDLLSGAADLTVVCTSRSALRLRGEYLLPLEPLPLPEVGAADVDAVLRSDAVRLFRARAAAAWPSFEVTEENAPAVAQVCRMLDGLPLALELAAARIRVLPPGQMLARVGRRLQLLTGGGRDLPERHRSMRAALDWSAQLLDPVEATVFAQLSVFAGGWTVEAAEAVCRPGDAEEDGEVVDVLARLADRSLVAGDGNGRLSMLETIRDYAADVLAADGDADRVRDRHAHYYADLAEELGPQCRTYPDSTTRSRLDAEAANLAAALDHAQASGDVALLGRLVLGLLDYWFFSGRIAQADRWLGAATATPLPPDLRTRLRLYAGSLAFIAADLARAAPSFEEAVAAARELGDTALLARSLAGLGATARFGGDLERALVLVREALDLAEGAGLDAMVPQLRNEVGELLDASGRPAEATPLFEDYRRQALLDGDRSNLAWACANLALQAQERAGPQRASKLVAEALAAADEGGAAPVRGDVRVVAGLLALRAGQPERALGLLREGLDLVHGSGLLLSVADTVSLIGAACTGLGLAEDGARLLATGRTWRRVRGLTANGRTMAAAITEAERLTTAALPAEALSWAEELGGRVPYGWVHTLDVPGPPGASQTPGASTVVNLRAPRGSDLTSR